MVNKLLHTKHVDVPHTFAALFSNIFFSVRVRAHHICQIKKYFSLGGIFLDFSQLDYTLYENAMLQVGFYSSNCLFLYRNNL